MALNISLLSDDPSYLSDGLLMDNYWDCNHNTGIMILTKKKKKTDWDHEIDEIFESSVLNTVT